MDLRQYFRKIREIENNMPEPHVFVTSLETPDGGKAGVVTEVPREIAARMITEGRALLSTKAERDDYLERQKQAREAAQRAELAQKLQVTVVADANAPRAVATDNAQRQQLKK
jgi:hypothetical protein